MMLKKLSIVVYYIFLSLGLSAKQNQPYRQNHLVSIEIGTDLSVDFHLKPFRVQKIEMYLKQLVYLPINLPLLFK